MPRPPQDVTDAELSVLQALWDYGPAATRQLAGRLYPGGTASHAATVQKLLERLENKGFVRRRRDSSPQLFEPAIQRDCARTTGAVAGVDHDLAPARAELELARREVEIGADHVA